MGKATYYNPPAVIRHVPGVVKRAAVEPSAGWTWSDFYSGTADALVAAGLLTPDMFPGQPGRARASACYRPAGVSEPPGSWCAVPGYMTVQRTPAGNFVVALTVTREEQTRREAAFKVARHAKESAAIARKAEAAAADAAAKDLVRVSVLMPRYVAEQNGMLRRPRAPVAHLRLVWSAPAAAIGGPT